MVKKKRKTHSKVTVPLKIGNGLSHEEETFYQTRFQRANQIIEAAEKGHVKTPSYKPDFLQDMKYVVAIRLLCKQAVYSKWNVEKNPSSLRDVFNFVKHKIVDMIERGEWNPREWTPPGKRTVDRRTNETADMKYWNGESTPVIAVSGGVYMPNPRFFDGETKAELEKLIRDACDE